MNAKLPVSHRLNDPKPRPKFNKYRVVFGIISDREGGLELPFFSRLNFKHASKRLEAYGFRVAKAKIDVSETLRKLSRFR